MAVTADEVANVVLSEFKKLPAKRKPTVRGNGLHEWVPLSGIVAKGCFIHISLCGYTRYLILMSLLKAQRF